MAITKVSSELIKDNSITMDKMHTGVVITTSEGLHNNANDTVLPTAGAVAAYVTSQVTGADNWDLSFAWGDHSTYGYATETYVDNSIANVINSAPAALDTLNELAAALGDDPNFATTVTNLIAGKQDAGTYNTIIGTDTDINTSGATIVDNIYVTDGVITSMGTRTLTLGDLGYTGATNANYITNNNQLTNGAGYITSFDITTQTDPKYLRSNANDTYTGVLSFGSLESKIYGGDSYPLMQVNSGRAYFGSTSRSKSVIASSDTIKHVRAGTEYDIWTAYNDGSGSGLDADLLDGLHASAFAASSHTHTWANILGETANSVNDWGGLRHQTNDGYIDFGPANGSWAHIYSDRPGFYFNKQLVVNGGSTINTGDIRSSIFYDINNTAYNLNPSSTADTALNIRGGALFGPNTTWSRYLMVGGDGRSNYTNNTSVASVTTTNGNLHLDSASGFDMYLNFYDGDGVKFGSGASGIVGEILSDGSARFPIFYDYNNTGYYLDPASTSTTNNITGNIFSGIISTSGDGQNNYPFRLNSDYSSYMVAAAGNTWGLFWAGNSGARYGTNGQGGPGNIWGNSANPNEFVFVGSDSTKWTLYGNDGRSWQAGSGQSAVDFRAPIFYDSVTTSRYIDPGSTSNINGLVLQNDLRITSGHGRGVRFWDSDSYKIHMSGSSQTTWGGRVGGETTSDYNMYFTMTGGTNRGWVFKNVQSTSGAVAGIDASGNGRFEGDLIAFSASDKRLKDNIKPIENALDKVNKISGVEFDWNGNQDTYAEGMHDIGVIAQEIEEIIPEVVKTRDNGYKAVKYEKIVPLLIEAIKEQQTQIDELKQLINKQ